MTYPGYDKILLITNCGRMCLNRHKIHIGKAFANQPVGLTEVDSGIWQIDFMRYTLGFFDEESGKLAPTDDPFAFKII